MKLSKLEIIALVLLFCSIASVFSIFNHIEKGFQPLENGDQVELTETKLQVWIKNSKAFTGAIVQDTLLVIAPREEANQSITHFAVGRSRFHSIATLEQEQWPPLHVSIDKDLQDKAFFISPNATNWITTLLLVTVLMYASVAFAFVMFIRRVVLQIKGIKW